MVVVPQDSERQRESAPGWWLTGVFVVAAMLGLWWAQLQQLSIQSFEGSTFQTSGGRWLLWSLTLVAVGVSFGLAVASASGWRGRISTAGLAWVIVPLVPIVLLQLWFAGALNMTARFLLIMTSLGAQVACAIAVGLFVAALLAPLLPSGMTD